MFIHVIICVYIYIYIIIYIYGSVSKPCTPVVHIKIAGIHGCSSMFIPLKMVLIGIDPYPYIYIYNIHIDICRYVHPNTSGSQAATALAAASAAATWPLERWLGPSNRNPKKSGAGLESLGFLRTPSRIPSRI